MQSKGVERAKGTKNAKRWTPLLASGMDGECEGIEGFSIHFGSGCGARGRECKGDKECEKVDAVASEMDGVGSEGTSIHFGSGCKAKV